MHGCILIIPQAARTSFNLVVSLFLFSSLLPEPRCTIEMRRNKNRRRTGGTAHRFSPLNHVRWLQHRFAPTPDRFFLLSSLLRFPSLSRFLLVFSYFDSLPPRDCLVLCSMFSQLAFIIDTLQYCSLIVGLRNILSQNVEYIPLLRSFLRKLS